MHPRRVARLAILVGGLAGCAAPAGAPSVSDRGALAFLVNGDTTVVDEYVRTADRLEGAVRIFSREPGGPAVRAAYSVDYDGRGRASSARLAIQQTSGGEMRSPATREWSVTLQPDGRVTEVEAGDGRRFDVRAGPDVVPLFGPSVAMMESILLRARATGVTRIPVFHIAAAGRVDTVAVAWTGADSAVVTIAGATARYRLDATGRIICGRAEAERLETVRIH